MKKNKVLFVLDCLELGESRRAITNILNHLNREKFQCSLAAVKKGSPGHKNITGPICLYDLKACSAKFAFIKLRRVIKKVQPDIVFSAMRNTHELVYLANKFLLSPPPAVMRSDTTESHNPEGKSFIARYLLRSAHSSAARTVVLTEAMKAELIRNFNLLPGKVKVIPDMIDLEYITQKAEEPLTDKIIRDRKGEPLIITVGRLTGKKGHDILLKAFAEYRSRDNKGFLILIGDGPREEELKNLANRLGINRDIWFAGNKDNPYKYIKVADIFVLSSPREYFPMVLLEAMACGTPVIAADCYSGPSEIITPGLDGLLVEPQSSARLAEAIRNLIAERRLRLNLVENGLKTAEAYSTEKIIQKYDNLFFEVSGRGVMDKNIPAESGR